MKSTQLYYVITTLYRQYVVVDRLVAPVKPDYIYKWNHTESYLDRFGTYLIYDIKHHYKIECYLLSQEYIPKKIEIRLDKLEDEAWRMLNGVTPGG